MCRFSPRQIGLVPTGRFVAPDFRLLTPHAASMELSREIAEQVAELARLRLSSEQLDRLTGELAQIVHFVEQLDELDTTDVEPLAHVMDINNVLAEDLERDSLAREEALANAPKQNGEFFQVPAVL
jgi:aspartyl-tRNA(Asn)/glutamyl-tRNA(Gln) amidotransferase subunit C